MSEEETLSCWGRSEHQATDAPEGRYTHVNAGGGYSCAVGVDRLVSCWGWNAVGQTESPPGRFARVDGGSRDTCALTESRELICWGARGAGSIPNGYFEDLSVGDSHACALSDRSEIVCWGSNSFGQTDAPPGQFVQISAGKDHNCAVRQDAALVCWGGDQFYGTPLARDYPARIVARLLESGAIEFGFQPVGAEPILPRSRFFPPDVRVNRWLMSSDIAYGGEVVGRIAARLLENGRVEFGFVSPEGERILPDQRMFPISAQVDTWLRSGSFRLDRP
ncbi:MAG: RCC1 domain-containing protein [Chloroflexi bacterium]|nr:RCC1 domain-containing protein [Chloroflexota bacterium]MCY3588015.1 RCC1 domain-containing protein [Chloroflexota bacterium]MCY3685705.1 RCC1 domain-containing protein [Chloroflexota bacterium]MDE2709189.1 RCC1 domain-containing protein [Chloroflexota bacterium]